MFSPPTPFLVGMVHLPALPGSPQHRLSRRDCIAHAVADARVLADAGFDALMIENFGDAPFCADHLEPVTIAALGIIAAEVGQAVSLPVGINALRNDAQAALGIAVAAGASFIRVNVHIGVSAGDQGWLVGRADETLRARQRLAADIAILADVHVKHATPISQTDIALAAEETAYRGLADGLIVTGSTTGRAVDLDAVEKVKQAVPDKPVLAGSGATAETVAGILAVADGVIVGSSLKPEGRADRPVDAKRAAAFIGAARA
ncbi:MAG: BtpA/SgcQ family protein [Phycisphaerae bacterium]